MSRRAERPPTDGPRRAWSRPPRVDRGPVPAPTGGEIGATVAMTAALVGAAYAPEVVVLGWLRLAPTLVLAWAAWLVVGRVGAIDLSLAAAAGLGGLGGGVLAATLGVDGFAVLPLVALGGAVVGATAGAVVGRVGRLAGALATLGLGAGLLAAVRGLEVLGGASGFHAVPLLAGGDRSSALWAAGLVVVAAWVVGAAGRSRPAALAAVGVAAPPVAAAAGRRPVVDVARVGAIGGAVAATAGLLAATATGSVQVEAFGTALAAEAVLLGALAQALRRALPSFVRSQAPLLAGLLVAGPSILFPLAPWVGTAPRLLVAGPVGLALVALLSRRGELPTRPTHVAFPRDAADGTASGEGPHGDDPAGPTPEPAADRSGLVATGLAVPAGDVGLAVAPGEVLAVTGPNGAGKSTLLARLGGQLPGGDVRLDGGLLDGRPRRRAAAGLARAWQRPPAADPADVLAVVAGPAPDLAALDVAEELLPPAHDLTSARARAVLLGLSARRPAVALLDEPAAPFTGAGAAEAVGAWLRSLAAAGTALVVVEHRPEVVAVADRRLEVHRPDAARRPDRPDEADVPAPPGLPNPRRGSLHLGEVAVAPDVCVLDHLRALPGAPGDAHLVQLLSAAPLLAGRGDDPAGWLSGGERQVLGWLRVLAAPTRELVLDGAGRGLDAATLAWAGGQVDRLRAAGVTVDVRPGRPEERPWGADDSDAPDRDGNGTGTKDV